MNPSVGRKVRWREGGRRVRGLRTLLRAEGGATAVEYGLILALIFLAVAGAIHGVASVTINMWGNVSDQVSNAH